MLRDIMRFYRESPALLNLSDAGPVLGEYLAEHGYSDAFRDDHLVPMASALWSSPSAQILAFPAKYLVQFMANHQMLQTSDRPQWRVVKGGSQSYVRAIARPLERARTRRAVRRGGYVVMPIPSRSKAFPAASNTTMPCLPAMPTRRWPCWPIRTIASVTSLAP